MKRLCLLLLLALPLTLRAQESAFTVCADYLTRGEIRQGGLTVSEAGEHGYARFLLSRTRLKRTADDNRLSWAWLMLQVTPKFFSTR